jgi:DNA-binding transcriptional ArsR family regulator
MRAIPAPEQLDRVFSALSDPTRRAIVQRLAQGEATPTELAAPFDLSQPTISQHLKVLEEAGLISMRRDAQRRVRRVEQIALRWVDDWIDPFRQQWEDRLDRLDEHLATTSLKGTDNAE